MIPSRVARACYRWLLRRAAPSLDAADVDEAFAAFNRLQAEAWRTSVTAWLAFWARELRALVSLWWQGRTHPGRAIAALSGDLRHATRVLARQPLFTLVVIATLALGIGVNGATLTLLDRLLLRGPVDVVDAGSLVRVYRTITRPLAGAQTSAWLPYETYRHLEQRSRSFDAVGAYGVRDTIVGAGANARIMRVGMVLGAFFDTLDARPARGRFFDAREDAAAEGPFAVLSDQLWRADFAASPSVLGGRLIVDGIPTTIVGIAPKGFSGSEMGRVDAWVLGNTATAAAYNWKVVARLRSGISRSAASADLAAVHVAAEDDEPKWMGDATLFAAPIGFDDAGQEPTEVQIARWLGAIAALLLIITCANVANLLIVRLARRRRELQIRVALGSGVARVVRLVALEGLLLTAAGGCASVVVATLALTAAGRAFVSLDSGWTDSSLGLRLFAAIASAAIVAAAAVALLPAVHVGTQAPGDVLRDRSDAGPGRSRTRAALTIAQAAISFILLAGAGLFLVSLRHVAAVPLGTEPERVLVVEARLARPPVPAGRAEFQRFLETLRTKEYQVYERLLASIRQMHGVESAAITLGLPLDNGSFSTNLDVPGVNRIPSLPGGGPYISAVGDRYFATIGTRIVRGRPFGERDGKGTEAVAIVSATTAARLWPGRDALGNCLYVGSSRSCSRIVGVAEDVHRVGLREEPSLQVYVPLGQEQGFAGARVLVRPVAGSPLSIAALREIVTATEPSVEFVDVHLLSEPLAAESRPLRVGLATFGASAGLAVVTAALGLYGLMAYIVAWRRREIGIRLALGATRMRIRGLVAGNGLVLAGTGVVIGLIVAIRAGPWVQPQLFETSASDPLVLGCASAVVLAIAAAAGAITTRRALRISPAESIRAE